MHERFYRALYRIRRVEEEIAAVYTTDKIGAPFICLGQGAVSVLCEALTRMTCFWNLPKSRVFG